MRLKNTTCSLCSSSRRRFHGPPASPPPAARSPSVAAPSRARATPPASPPRSNIAARVSSALLSRHYVVDSITAAERDASRPARATNRCGDATPGHRPQRDSCRCAASGTARWCACTVPRRRNPRLSRGAAEAAVATAHGVGLLAPVLGAGGAPGICWFVGTCRPSTLWIMGVGRHRFIGHRRKVIPAIFRLVVRVNRQQQTSHQMGGALINKITHLVVVRRVHAAHQRKSVLRCHLPSNSAFQRIAYGAR